ncbi:hypothetical protein AOR13_2038 [Alteromonas stellipolaris LMG 21856]|nr:hypothetical protein AOR13_2038 [Alteromonas stellipolaris LMG 21856]
MPAQSQTLFRLWLSFSPLLTNPALSIGLFKAATHDIE